MSVVPNTLYYGDNLDILRRYVADDSVDLVYLDPPFNSNASYNVLFAEQDGTRAAAQVEAFTDTWRWDQAAVSAYEETLSAGGRVADALRAMRTLLGGSNMLAYLSMMAPRLVELRRVLKPTGSLYLHCDPTASHYLKLLRDLRGVIERENAALGVLITMQAPTRPMRQEAAEAGPYVDAWGQRYPRLQLLTVGELLGGKKIEMPMFARNTTVAQAPDARAPLGT